MITENSSSADRLLSDFVLETRVAGDATRRTAISSPVFVKMPLCCSRGCGKTTAELRCSRCQAAFYCDAACQRADWKQHKKVCKATKELADAPSVEKMLPLEPSPGTSNLDNALGLVIANAAGDLDAIKSQPQRLPAVVMEVDRLLAAGATPHLRLFTLLCDGRLGHLEPILDALLQWKGMKPGWLNHAVVVACEGGDCKLSPLANAVLAGRAPLTRKLLAAGADPRPLCMQSPGHTGTGPDAFHPVGGALASTALHLCAQQARDRGSSKEDLVAIAEALVAGGADVNALDTEGRTPLLLNLEHMPDALEHPDKSFSLMPMKLIDLGADVHARDPLSQSRPLDLAAQLGLVDVLRALVSKGADPSPIPFEGKRVSGDHIGVRATSHYLQATLARNFPEVLRFAAEAGVDLGRVRCFGTVPRPMLAEAVFLGAAACVRYLLTVPSVKVNESYKILDYGRFTALDTVAVCNKPELAMLLLARGGKTYSQIQDERDESG